MSSPKSPKFRVAICGAGVGGLVLAITIGKYDPSIPIDLYEAHDSIETAGVGIAFWKRTNDILSELGLLDDIKQIYTQSPDSSHGEHTHLPSSSNSTVVLGPYLRRSDIREGGYAWFHQVHEFGPSFMHRQQMVAMLEKHLPLSCTVHARKRLVTYTESDDRTSSSSIILTFADGSTATADVLVGADGIRSAVRMRMFEAASEDEHGDTNADLRQYIDATWTGMSIYRSVIPAEAVRKQDPKNFLLKESMVCLGKHKFIMSYPIANGALVNVVAMVADPKLGGTTYEGHWVSDVAREELQCERVSKWALHVVKELPFCVRGRVSLIGDACHAMTPHFGAGAGQAIDDAFILGRLLAHPLTTLSRITGALQVYEKIRLPVATSVARLSISTGLIYIFMEPEFYDGTRKEEDLDERGISQHEREGMEQMRREIEGRWGLMRELGSSLEAWKDVEARLQEWAV